MPKKAKAKGGNATTEEIKALKLARDRTLQQLDIKSTQFMSLQEEYQRSQDLINNLERRLRRETDSLKQELQLKIDENTSLVEELQFEVLTQQEKLKLCVCCLHRASVVQRPPPHPATPAHWMIRF